jgi:hypothetical protein
MGADANSKKQWRNVKRSAKRILRLSKQIGPELAIETFRGLYQQIKFNRMLRNGLDLAQAESQLNRHTVIKIKG